MSYNIDTWRTKEIDNLTIPLSAIDKDAWGKELQWRGKPPVFKVSSGCYGDGLEIEGRVDDDNLLVESITCEGEGSGTLYSSTLQSILRASAGRLVAVQVWEGGDSITRLTVIDGSLKEEEVDV